MELKPLENEVIEARLGLKIWKNGVYTRDSLNLPPLTIFELKALLQEAQRATLRQIVGWLDSKESLIHDRERFFTIYSDDWQELEKLAEKYRKEVAHSFPT